MEAIVNIQDPIIDHFVVFGKALDNRKSFTFRLFRDDNDNSDLAGDECVAIWIEPNDNKPEVTFMFEIKKRDAIFLAKSMLAIAESLPESLPQESE